VSFAEQTEKQLKQYHMLIHLGQELIASLDLKTVLFLITKYAAQLLNSHSSVLLLRDDFTNETTYASVYNVTEELLQKKLLSSESLGNQIIDSKKPMVLNDYSHYPRRVALLEQYNIKAVVGVPIIWQEQAIGALNVHATDPTQQFSDNDINLLFAFANYAAIAITNAKLYSKINQELRHIKMINEISLTSNSDYTTEELLHWLAGKIKSSYPESDYVIMIYNSILGLIDHASSKVLPFTQIEELKKFTDQNMIKHSNESPMNSAISLICGSSNILAFSLARKQKILGYLFLLDNNPNKKTIQSIESIAAHIAIVLENALLNMQMSSDLKQLVDETNALNYAIRKITELSLRDNLSEQILNLALSFAKASKGCLFLFSHNSNCFEVNLSVNVPEEVKVKWANLLNKFYDSLSLSKLLTSSQLHFSNFGMRITNGDLINPYIFPLFFQDQLFAAIVIDAEQNQIPSNNLVIMQIFMDIAAIVMKNAELYQNEKKTVKELQNFSQQLIDSQNLLENVLNIHNMLLRQVLNSNTITEIAGTIYQHTCNPLLIEDGVGNVLAQYPAQHGLKTVYDNRNTQGFTGFYHELMEKKMPLSYREAENLLRYVVPLIAGDKIVGFLSLFASSNGFTLLQRHIAESSALALSLAIANANRALDLEQSLKGEILEALIDEKYERRKDNLLYRANYLGLSSESRYRLLIIDYFKDRHASYVRDSNPEEPVFLEKRLIAESLAAISHKTPAKFIFMSRPEGIVLAYPSGGGSKGSKDEIAEMLSFFIDDFNSRYSRNHSFVIGASTLLDCLLDFRKGFLEARQCIAIAQLCKHLDKALYFDDTGLLGFLFHEENRQLLTNFVMNEIGALIKYDQTNNPCLVDTLECYLDNDCNLAAAASELYIHINTLKYRLKKVSELISMDLSKTSNRVNLYAALKMYRIIWQNTRTNAH